MKRCSETTRQNSSSYRSTPIFLSAVSLHKAKRNKTWTHHAVKDQEARAGAPGQIPRTAPGVGLIIPKTRRLGRSGRCGLSQRGWKGAEGFAAWLHSPNHRPESASDSRLLLRVKSAFQAVHSTPGIYTQKSERFLKGISLPGSLEALPMSLRRSPGSFWA